MIIIIEGADGAGKTTLANKLAEQTGFPIVHRSNPKSEEEKKQMMAMYIQTIKENKNCIFDRCWYSEMVYGPVMRDKSYISEEQMYVLEDMLNQVGAVIIHCTASKKVLWSRCKKRGEDYIKRRRTLGKIRDGFIRVLEATPHIIPVITHVSAF